MSKKWISAIVCVAIYALFKYVIGWGGMIMAIVAGAIGGLLVSFIIPDDEEETDADSDAD